ncbi:hypothetical protein V8D89_008697 [Ganoderma adspersum]
MRVDGCEVWVSCEGQQLPEYDTQSEGDGGKTFACFISSETGKKFALEWQNNSDRDVLKFTVKLDGIFTKNKWSRPQENDSISGVRVGPTTMQPFQFSQLETTDSDDALHVPANADLGTIRVRVCRVKLVSVKKQRPRDFTLKFHSVGPIHERSKKLGAHCVTLGEATEVRYNLNSRKKWKSEVIDPDEGPLVEFIFRYRPLALLQAQDIAPPPIRSPGPSSRSLMGQDSQDDDARPAKRQRVGTAGSDGGIDLKPDISNLSDDDGDEDELGMLKGQLSQIMDRIAQMEQKKKRRKGGGSLKVKKEEPVPSSSRLGAGSGGVIDLTLSD